MRMKGRKSRDESRRGVALIIVLGFLSLMIIMAVAFLTQARIERLVSGMTLDAMRGRQLLRTGMNAAMNDYSTFLWDESLIVPSLLEDQVFTSVPPNPPSRMDGRTLTDDNISLLTGEVYDWIPRKYLLDPVSMQMVSNAQWILIREDPTDGHSRILGRYAYVCFDMSGGIDANLIARTEGVAEQDARSFTNRSRRSVRDVPMGKLEETISASEFKRLRKGWKGFDSLYSLIKLTDGIYIDGQSDFSSGDDVAIGQYPSSIRWNEERIEKTMTLDSEKVSDLGPFSLSAYRGGRYDRGAATWDKPVVMNDATDWVALLNPLDHQFALQANSWIQDAIYDYTHDTDVPRRMGYPSPKNIPMFNEFGVTYTLTEAPDPVNGLGFSLYNLVVTLDFEFWYPFPSADNEGAGTFSVTAPTVAVGRTPAPGAPTQIFIRGIFRGSAGVVFVASGAATPSSPAMTVDAKWNGGQPYVASPASITYTIPLTEITGAPLVSAQPLWIQSLNVTQPIQMMGSGVADEIPVDISFAAVPQLLSTMPSQSFTLEATDPRLNYQTGQWITPTTAKPFPVVMGDMNSWYTDETASRRLADREGMALYCRNGEMETPAELGFISNGKEFGSIDLCTSEGVELLSNLVGTNVYSQLQTNNWVVYTNGTINPNTRSTNVLASAFIGLSAEEVPHQDPSRIRAWDTDPERSISEGLAVSLAEHILVESDVASLPLAERFENAFQAGSDWARIPAMQVEKDLSASLNNHQRESLIRNTWGLFSPDNGLFTAVVIAQPIKEGPAEVGIWDEEEDRIVGERRAVALIWRDPFKTGNSLHHEMFIRIFRYLND
jgi:hypothetical protein